MDRAKTLRGGAIGAAGLAGGVLVGREQLVDDRESSSAANASSDSAPSGGVVAFRGDHQAGIDTRGQGHAAFASFDVTNRGTGYER